MTTTKTADTNLAKITAALAPAFDALKASCRERLDANFDRIVEKIEAHGWDLNAAFPTRYTSSHNRHDRIAAQRTRDEHYAACVVTTNDPEKDPYGYGASIPNTPTWVVLKDRDELAAARDKKAAAYARKFIDAYAVKLTAKVARDDVRYEIATVEYDGTADPFSRSRLIVTGSGARMVWNTRCIINVSCLGKVFNQWPTRKVRS